MAEGGRKTCLSDLELPKFPLRYGTDSCYIMLTDDRFSEDTIRLRNNPAFGRFLNYVELTREDHDRWLAEQLQRDDALNFVLIVEQKFAGILSLYDIQHGNQCELGRMMLPKERRIYAYPAELLALSFAFEVLGLHSVYCVVVEGNKRVWKLLLKIGWHLTPRYDRFQKVNGVDAHLLGLSIERAEWRQIFERKMVVSKRLFSQ